MAEGNTYLDKYKIGRLLGEGGFGQVYLCTDKNTDDRKALKKIPIGSTEYLEDVVKEAQFLSKFNHPGILHFYDSFSLISSTQNDSFCIVTEYCKQGDLDSMINAYKRRGESFPEEEVLMMTIQLTLALQYIHRQGILHRDLKPQNVFVSHSLLKIGDFGLSRILSDSGPLPCLYKAGTWPYLSPEVMKSEPYTSKIDIWALGCIVFELCALKTLFLDNQLLIIMGNLPRLPGKYSEEFNAVFKRLLKRNPEKRPSASEVLNMDFIKQFLPTMKNIFGKEYETKHKVRPEMVSSRRQDLSHLVNMIKQQREGATASSALSDTPNDRGAHSRQPSSAISSTSSQLSESGFEEENESEADKGKRMLVEIIGSVLERETPATPEVVEEKLLLPHGANARKEKVKALKKESLQIMGEKEFGEVYEYFKSARNAQSGDGMERTEKSIVESCLQRSNPPPDSFMMLLYLEQMDED